MVAELHVDLRGGPTSEGERGAAFTPKLALRSLRLTAPVLGSDFRQNAFSAVLV